MTDSKVKYVLSINKTKLYNLIKAKSPFELPKLRYTYYERSKRMYWFTYTSKNSRYVKCSFGSSYGVFFLRVEAFEYDEVFELSFEDLLSFDLVKEVHEENTSEPEQPEEDAEVQENPELSEEENKQGVELTPLELTLFQLESNSLKSYYGFCYLSELAEKQGLDDKTIEQYEANASLERHYVDLLRYIIKQAGLQKKHLLWLAERKKQEALEAKNI